MTSAREYSEERSSATSRTSVLIVTIAVLLGACGGEPMEPEPTRLAVNTLAIEVSGVMQPEIVVPAFGGFQSVTTGEGEGVHIYADPGGFPFAIHLPGRPEAGEMPMGRWDPSSDFLYEGGVLTTDPLAFRKGEGAEPIYNVGRVPSVSFSDHPAAVFDCYASLDGTVEIDAITIPGSRDFKDHPEVPRGGIRARLEARAAVDARLPPGCPAHPDTVDISVEFHVELENWRDGRATVHFTDGALSGVSAPFLIGSGTEWRIGEGRDGPLADSVLLVGLAGEVAGDDERLEIWFGTKLLGSGSATLEAVDPRTVAFVEPLEWPDHFVAARVGGPDGDLLESLSGAVELDAFEEYEGDRWGEMQGRIVVEFGVQGSSGDDRPQRSTAEITFWVPFGFSIEHHARGSSSLVPSRAPALFLVADRS